MNAIPHAGLPVGVIGAGLVGLAAAREVCFVLPETGVCGVPPSIAPSSCCGGAAPATADACCTDDAVATTNGQDGCGCPAPVAEPAVTKAGCRQSAA